MIRDPKSLLVAARRRTVVMTLFALTVIVGALEIIVIGHNVIPGRWVDIISQTVPVTLKLL